jgi:hypothetical protein
LDGITREANDGAKANKAKVEPDCTMFMIVPDEANAKWGIPVCFGYGNEAVELGQQRKDASLLPVTINRPETYITLNDLASPKARKGLAENQVFFGAPRDDMLGLMEQGEAENVVHITQIGTVNADFVRSYLLVRSSSVVVV